VGGATGATVGAMAAGAIGGGIGNGLIAAASRFDRAEHPLL
jgi:hypothetical protein